MPFGFDLRSKPTKTLFLFGKHAPQKLGCRGLMLLLARVKSIIQIPLRGRHTLFITMINKINYGIHVLSHFVRQNMNPIVYFINH
jgi:hypothetical protein